MNFFETETGGTLQKTTMQRLTKEQLYNVAMRRNNAWKHIINSNEYDYRDFLQELSMRDHCALAGKYGAVNVLDDNLEAQNIQQLLDYTNPYHYTHVVKYIISRLLEGRIQLQSEDRGIYSNRDVFRFILEDATKKSATSTLKYVMRILRENYNDKLTSEYSAILSNAAIISALYGDGAFVILLHNEPRYVLSPEACESCMKGFVLNSNIPMYRYMRQYMHRVHGVEYKREIYNRHICSIEMWKEITTAPFDVLSLLSNIRFRQRYLKTESISDIVRIAARDASIECDVMFLNLRHTLTPKIMETMIKLYPVAEIEKHAFTAISYCIQSINKNPEAEDAAIALLPYVSKNQMSIVFSYGITCDTKINKLAYVLLRDYITDEQLLSTNSEHNRPPLLGAIIVSRLRYRITSKKYFMRALVKTKPRVARHYLKYIITDDYHDDVIADVCRLIPECINFRKLIRLIPNYKLNLKRTIKRYRDMYNWYLRPEK